MISRDRRIDKHLFREVFSRGNSLPGTYVYAKVLPLLGEKSRFAFSVPRSVAKSAVKRNTLRRKGYTCLESYINDIPDGYAVIFFFKKESRDPSPDELCIDIKEISQKIKS